MIPASHYFDQPTITILLDHDPLVAQYRAFFSLLDWSLVSTWEDQQGKRGRPAHPEAAYLKAFLVRIREGLIYTSQLRRFLLNHPLLVVELGFHLTLDPSALYGFDPQQTIPCEWRLRNKLRTFDPTLLQALLQATVHALQDEIPGLGETVAFDVKHIYAKGARRTMNGPMSPNATTKPTRAKVILTVSSESSARPISNNLMAAPRRKKNSSGVMVLALLRLLLLTTAMSSLQGIPNTRNEGDVTYFRPLYQQTALALQLFPTHVTADAAFDAWYVYDVAARHGGIGAVPLNQHTKTMFTPDGIPFCAKGLLMHPTVEYDHTYGYRARRFQCPLLFPQATGETCEHDQFAKGKGCVKNVNQEAGGLQRITLDRHGPLYRAVYTQRTSCERIGHPGQSPGY